MGGYFNGGGMIPLNLGNPRFGRSFCNFTLAGLLLLLASVSVAAAAQFLRPEANYVLVTGLPGDLESESTYRDQLQTWLEILEGIRPKQIIALTDNPESVSLGVSATANSSITFLPSSRSNFLAVSSLITASTNPLVVVVWGHGGK